MADAASIYESVMAEQEKFAQLTEQLAAERRTVANQLEKVRLSRDSGMAGSGYLEDNATGFRGWGNVGPAILEDYENNAVDPVLVNRKVDTKVDKKVYRSERIQRRLIGDPGYCADGSFYASQQDTEAPIHESRYTTTHTNCQPTADLLDNGSLGEDPNLVSRNTSSTTTQEVTTVTKVYRTYERVPAENLAVPSSCNRDYDYPEEYIADYESQLYARPYNRKYGSPGRFDYRNGTGQHDHHHDHHQANGDVFDRTDLYASGHSAKGSSVSVAASSTPGRKGNKQHPVGRSLDDVGYGPPFGMAVDGYSSASPTAAAGPSNNMAQRQHSPDYLPTDVLMPSTAHPTANPVPQYRDPELPEVIEFLRSPSNVIKANAAAHLAHLAFNNDPVKNLARQLGAIPPLLEMLTSAAAELQRNACSALRNLAFGRTNDENKRTIKSCGGLGTLIKLLKQTQDSEIGELVTAILWILSSCDDLKKPILDEASPLLIRQIIIPHSAFRPGQQQTAQSAPRHAQYNSTVFRNSSGVIRNVSSAGFQARKILRESENLIAALLLIVKDAVDNHDVDNKSVENVVCILRNLSFRCQEVEDPEYDKKRKPQSKKSDKGSQSAPGSLNGTPAKNTPYSNLKGLEALWSTDNVQKYFAILSTSANHDTLEAAAGVLQNLSACHWQPSVDIRAAVRKEKGLPVLVELLKIENDRVVCSVARALRNLAVDQRNRELIGKYAMRDLAAKIPGPPEFHTQDLLPGSDETVAAILAIINEVVKKEPEFARLFLDAGGVHKLVHITTNYNQYSSKVVRFAFLVLQTLWAHHSLHDVYRVSGWKESHFLTKPPNMSTKTLGGTDTLGRTFSSQGPTKFEDKTLPRGAFSQDEEDSSIPMNILTSSSKGQNGHRTHHEPVYAQINRAEKVRQRQIRENGNGESGGNVDEGIGGDSWV